MRLVTGQAVKALGVDGAGVAPAPGYDRRLQLETATDDDIAGVEAQQVSAGEGPCHEAYLTGEMVTVADRELEDRWPSYRQGREAGIRAAAGILMPVADQRLGVLSFYRHRRRTWGAAELETAQLTRPADTTAPGWWTRAIRAEILRVCPDLG